MEEITSAQNNKIKQINKLKQFPPFLMVKAKKQ